MDIFDKEHLNHLLERSGRSLLSLYMPTHRTGREMQQDPIRFKNLLSQAEQNLSESGLQKPEIDSALKFAHRLQVDGKFWQHMSDGLALFLSEDFMEFYRLPVTFEPLLIISERFYIKPLLPLINKNGHFYILALSQKEIRLFKGGLFGIDEIDLKATPTSLQEALPFDDPEKQLQFHTGGTSPRNTGSHPAEFHGQGATEADAKTNLLRYFQKVDQGVIELLGSEKFPLVLAGLDYLLPIYREANSYPHLITESIEGNPDQLSTGEIHQLAWKLIEGYFAADEHKALGRFEELQGAGSKLASTKIEKILPAAYFGRVDTLFVAQEIQFWGTLDSEGGILEKHQKFRIGDQDLLDIAAAQTLLNRGLVYALDLDRMPGENPIAAIFRYTYDEHQTSN